jgi:predicted enzyme related to lactoylglutathione lyase
MASLYQLSRSARDAGVPSHWTPYVRVDDASLACSRAIEVGGSVAVEPFTVEGAARIALIVDPVGAPFGVWEPLSK